MFSVGDRIQLVRMDDDPEPIPVGSKGTVIFCNKFVVAPGRSELQVGVKWDNGRGLHLCIPPDVAILIKE